MSFHRFLVPLLAAGAAAAIAGAPVAAAADPHQTCTYSSAGNSVCSSAGNAQVVATPPDVPYQQWGFYPYGGVVILGDGHLHGGHR